MSDIKNVIDGLNFFKVKLYNGIFGDKIGCFDEAISALAELSQYRALGTPEECREAREKQKAKKPSVLVNDHDVKIGHATYKKGTKTYKCACGGLIGKIHKFCPDCGQAIDWSKGHNA